MKLKIVIVLWALKALVMASEINFNLVFEPKIAIEKLQNPEKLVNLQTKINEICSDSIATINLNFFLGRLFQKSLQDSLYVNYCEMLLADYISPLDFTFNEIPDEASFKILGSNLLLQNKSNLLQQELILETD